MDLAKAIQEVGFTMQTSQKEQKETTLKTGTITFIKKKEQDPQKKGVIQMKNSINEVVNNYKNNQFNDSDTINI